MNVSFKLKTKLALKEVTALLGQKFPPPMLITGKSQFNDGTSFLRPLLLLCSLF